MQICITNTYFLIFWSPKARVEVKWGSFLSFSAMKEMRLQKKGVSRVTRMAFNSLLNLYIRNLHNKKSNFYEELVKYPAHLFTGWQNRLPADIVELPPLEGRVQNSTGFDLWQLDLKYKFVLWEGDGNRWFPESYPAEVILWFYNKYFQIMKKNRNPDYFWTSEIYWLYLTVSTYLK